MRPPVPNCQFCDASLHWETTVENWPEPDHEIEVEKRQLSAELFIPCSTQRQRLQHSLLKERVGLKNSQINSTTSTKKWQENSPKMPNVTSKDEMFVPLPSTTFRNTEWSGRVTLILLIYARYVSLKGRNWGKINISKEFIWAKLGDSNPEA